MIIEIIGETHEFKYICEDNVKLRLHYNSDNFKEKEWHGINEGESNKTLELTPIL